MSKVSRGNAAEVRVSKEFERRGAVVGSRRHIGGAGDLIVVWPDGRLWLVEVKTDKGSPFANFRPERRESHLETAARVGADSWLAWAGPTFTRWIPSEAWPT